MEEKRRSSKRVVSGACSFIRKKVVPNVEEYDTS
jgi:hypothetical protein